MNNNLVFIPAGKTSEHQKWSELHLDYGFDLCLVNFTRDHEFSDINSKSAKFQYRSEGMKFELISKFFDDHPDWNQYDRVLMMDDDIETTPSNIQRFFDICREENFDLAQPSLSNGSTFTFHPTLKIPNSKYHLTNMVEIMMPCLSKRLLEQTIEDIRECPNGIGWGLEGVWNTRFHQGEGMSVFGGKIGVVDDVEFYHRRPLGGGESKIYEKFGSPRDALAHQERRVGFDWSSMRFITHSVRWKTHE